MTTKIHASRDALGNPAGFHLTPGQACDLDESDVLLPDILGRIEAFLADKAYDVQERVFDLLEKADVKIVIPPKSNRTQQRDYDKDLYQARHLIENFFANSSNTALSLPDTINAQPPSSALFTSPPLLSGLVDDTP